MAHKKILFLGPEDSPLITWLREQGEEVIQTADKLSAQTVAGQEFTFLVSYGYRHILRKEVLDIFPGKASIFTFPTFRGIVALTQTSGVS